MVTTRAFAVLGICLIVGLGLFGAQVGLAVKKGRGFDRYLTVRGLSEVEVKANLAIWPIRFSVHAEDLAALKALLERDRALVMQFLVGQGISTNEVTQGIPAVMDRLDQKMNPEMSTIARYKGSATLVLRSENVDLVKQTIQRADTLLEQGVSLSDGDYGDRTQFLFTDVNAIKPSMIQEATANARLAAQKFAQDSSTKVGAIRRATQGILEMEDRDAASPERKRLRIVTTVEFFVE